MKPIQIRRSLRFIWKVSVALILASVMTVVVGLVYFLYYPPAFKGLLTWSVESINLMKQEHRGQPEGNMILEIMSKQALATRYQSTTPPAVPENPEQWRNLWLQSLAEEDIYSPISLFFTEGALIDTSADDCNYHIIGVHRQLDVAWDIEVTYCLERRHVKGS